MTHWQRWKFMCFQVKRTQCTHWRAHVYVHMCTHTYCAGCDNILGSTWHTRGLKTSFWYIFFVGFVFFFLTSLLCIYTFESQFGWSGFWLVFSIFKYSRFSFFFWMLKNADKMDGEWTFFSCSVLTGSSRGFTFNCLVLKEKHTLRWEF